MLGQGSALLAQLFLRDTGYLVELGVVVIIFSLWSFSFQFSDFGNATVANKLISKNDISAFGSFLIGRVVMSVFSISVVSFQLAPLIKDHVGYGFFISLILTAFIYPLSGVAAFESKGRYKAYAAIQATPWLCMSLLMLIVFYGSHRFLLNGSIVAISLIYISLAAKPLFSMGLSLKKIKFKDCFMPFAVIFPALVGQFWGREMIVIITKLVDLSVLGPLGIVRGIHTAFSLLLNMIIRPHIAGLAASGSRNFQFRTITIYLLIFLIILTIPNSFDLGISQDIDYWLPVLMGIPFWAFTSYLAAINQVILAPKIFMIVDIFSFSIHIITFLILVNYSPPWAFAASDMARCVYFGIVFSITSIPQIKGSRIE